MAKNMTFTTSLKLNSSGFKKGVQDVQKSLNSLKNSFLSLAGALGAGLGFAKLTSNLKDTAVQLSVAKSVLENVSNETVTYTDGINKMDVAISNYNENLAFARKLAKDYSQDLVSIIENFAQFHAACQKTNLGLEEQKDVFESLTKAAAYFHLSADKTKDMMTAVTQMMSKGKVASEELRRQLGNVLPGAFNLMAAALGVSNAELEDMMKKGQVLSAEALPRFAAMLNTVTKNANFDSLQLSMNQLKNSWYELVESTGFENFYAKIINGANDVVSYLGKNFNTVVSYVKGAVATILSFKLFDAITARGDKFIKDTEKQLGRLKMYAERYIQQYNKSLAVTPNAGNKSISINKDTGVASGNYGLMDEKALRAMKDYNDVLIKQAQLRRDLLPPMSKAWQVENNIITSAKAVNAEIARANPALAANVTTTTLWQRAYAGVASVAKQVGAALKSIGIMAIVSAIIGAITTIISKVKELKAEAKRVANIVEDYHSLINKVNEGVEAENAKLRANLAIVKDSTKSEAQRLFSLKEINKALGLVGEKQLKLEDLEKMEGEYDKITAAVKRWCDATVLQAKIQAQAGRIAQAQARQQDIEAEKAEKRSQVDEIEAKQAKPWNKHNPMNVVWDIKKAGLNKEIATLNKEFEQEAKVIGLAEQALKDLGVELADIVQDTGNGGGGGGQSDISKVFDKYNADLKELENQLKEHAITQEEFNDEFNKLVEKYFKAAAATGSYSIEAIIAKADKGKALTAMEKWYKDLYDAAQKAGFEAVAKLAADAIDKSLDDAIDAMQKAMDEEMDKYLDKVIEAGEKTAQAVMEKSPKRGKRDKTFDYKATASDALGDEHRLAQERVDALQGLIDKYKDLTKYNSQLAVLVAGWTEELKKAKKEATSLEKAMKYAQVKEDIVSMQKEFDNLAYSSIKDMASSMDRVVKGAQALRDTIEDSDASAWEKFIAIFDTAINIMDTVLGVFKTLEEVSKLSATIESANLSLIELENDAYKEQIELLAVINQLKGETLNETLKQKLVDILASKASKQAASAKAGEAVAGATASGAKLAFPYNLIAIAAGVAAVITALASMSKYASGGIVGGNSTQGDNVMARVNSGEMILNKHQQATLFNAINSGKLGGGNVTFKLRGTDLIGAINNEQSRRRG